MNTPQLSYQLQGDSALSAADTLLPYMKEIGQHRKDTGALSCEASMQRSVAGNMGMNFKALLALVVFLSAGFTIFAQEQTPLGKTASKWTGVDFEVMKIERPAANRVVLVVRVHAGSRADNPTFIGFPRKSSPVETAKGIHPVTDPLSLKQAVLVETATQKNYPALAEAPASPFVGPIALITSMRPNEWIQMGVQFPAPPAPLPDETGKVPDQKIVVIFPNSELPTKDFVLPPFTKP